MVGGLENIAEADPKWASVANLPDFVQTTDDGRPVEISLTTGNAPWREAHETAVLAALLKNAEDESDK